MKPKIAIYSGLIPTTTFVENLIKGLSKEKYKIYLFGTKRSKVIYDGNVEVKGNEDNQVHKFLILLKYTFLLMLFKPNNKRKLDCHIRQKKINIRLSKLKFYPVLWNQPDVFHLQWAKGTKDWIWVQDFGIKLVVSLRGTHISVSPVANCELAQEYKEIFPKVDSFHAVSKALAKQSEKYGANPKKIKVVYSGLPKVENFLEKDKYSVETLPIQILSVGRAHWIKGYNYALDACALLKNQGFNFHYTIVGVKNSEELELQKNDLGLNDYVKFTENVSQTMVKQLMLQSDLFLLPSVEEGVANVVLEAMSLQKIVITTNCGGMEEVVNDGVNGFIVPIRNPGAIAQKIIEISTLSQIQVNEIAAKAREKIEAIHSEEKMVEDMKSLYDFVLDKKALL